MVSEAFKRIEDAEGQGLIVFEEFLTLIAQRLGKSEQAIDRSIHLACVSCNTRPIEMVIAINTFLACLNEVEHPPPGEPQP